MQKEAAKLASQLQNRMEGRLSKNPRITALALAIYDPTLPTPLAAELHKVNNEIEDEDEGNDMKDKAIGAHPAAHNRIQQALETEELLDELK